MSDASWPLQKALFAALGADADLTALLGTPPRIHDAVPAEAVCPYLTIGEVRSRNWPGMDGGQQHDLRLHVWSRHGGRKEIKTLFAAIANVLENADLSLDGHRLVSMRFVFSDCWHRPEHHLWHGTQRFRATTEKL